MDTGGPYLACHSALLLLCYRFAFLLLIESDCFYDGLEMGTETSCRAFRCQRRPYIYSCMVASSFAFKRSLILLHQNKNVASPALRRKDIVDYITSLSPTNRLMCTHYTLATHIHISLVRNKVGMPSNLRAECDLPAACKRAYRLCGQSGAGHSSARYPVAVRGRRC